MCVASGTRDMGLIPFTVREDKEDQEIARGWFLCQYARDWVPGPRGRIEILRLRGSLSLGYFNIVGNS
ncbi:hypothetical protein L1987_60823 [Smallanthus sonchifolius]|uniref:Uncharacterized protein n=1 Tax=Smallanthus sonchifolius TaxID=185202 RepID=A0ACB9D9H4_9ASTR|nr:hypothetical protein L1987_60823 [Smallanthus sonchifolius]